LAAATYAAAHQLQQVTLSVTDIEGADCVVDHATRTVHIQPGLSLAQATAYWRAGIQALCGGSTVVVDDDGTAWSTPPATTASGEICPVPAPRANLKVVPNPTS
jgi:hypothetical protein